MTPFEVPPSMATFADPRPSACDLLSVAGEGGADACAALARTWITEGIPVAFEQCPAVYDSMRVWLADELKVHAKQIGLTGSARFGFSFVTGQRFGPRSDLDFFVVSEPLFYAYRDEFSIWHDDFRSGRAVPNNKKEREYWKENARRVPRNLNKKFVDVNRIPSRMPYQTARQTLDAMSRLVRKLAATPCSPSPPKASVRCYRDWKSLVRQMSLNLNNLGAALQC